ncbi:MAG: hypothetical protein R3D89_06260 [Sphingomonadaceae bacterium]|jgi:hypothetical protein
MTNRLKPYGSDTNAANFAKAGKGGPQKGITPQRLAERMPGAEIAAKVGMPAIRDGKRVRVVRLKA